MCTCTNLFLYILAILFPPLPVWVKRGLCSADSLVNLALCCLGLLPGLLHSFYIIASTPDSYEYEEIRYVRGPRGDVEAGTARRAQTGEDGAVRYIYVMQGGGNGGGSGSAQQQQGAPAGEQRSVRQQRGAEAASYGTIPQGPVADLPPPTYHEAIKGDNKIQGR